MAIKIGDLVKIVGKSVNVPVEITNGESALIGKKGRVTHIAGPVIYVSIKFDLLAFSEKDLEEFDWDFPL